METQLRGFIFSKGWQSFRHQKKITVNTRPHYIGSSPKDTRSLPKASSGSWGGRSRQAPFPNVDFPGGAQLGTGTRPSVPC